MKIIVVIITVSTIFLILVLSLLSAQHNTASQGTITQYYESGQLITERNPHYKQLSLLYVNPLGKFFRPLLTTRWAARCAGWYYNSSMSKSSIQPFIETYQISMDDYQIPERGFSSFNNFFIRSLKPNKRPLALSPLICPTDGKVYVIEQLTPTASFFVKDIPFNLTTFLGSEQQAAEYAGGTLVIIRLAPYDYHRFHFPLDCVASAPKIIHGRYESVNPLVYRQGIMPLTTNERQLVTLHTKEYGDVAMVIIGALFVGAISTTYTPDAGQPKGEEAGYFSFGGSSIALLFKKNSLKLRQDLIAHSQQGYETALRFGESLVNQER